MEKSFKIRSTPAGETIQKYEKAKPLQPIPGGKPGVPSWTPNVKTADTPKPFGPVVNPKPFAI